MMSYCGLVVWVSLKIIALMVSLGSLLSLSTNIANLVQPEQTQILGELEVGYGKMCVQSTKAVIYNEGI